VSAPEPEVVLVRMSHPASGGEYAARPEQVPHLEQSGWQRDPDQEAEGERWPEDLQRFGGQAQVRMRHPDLDTEITVAESAVPMHRSNGWQVVDEAAVTDAARATDDLEALTVEELKEEARGRGLPVSGTKAELIERLQEPPAEPEQDDDQPAGPASPEEG